MEMTTQEIGRIIADKRRGLDLTLEEVGNRVGVTKSTIQRYETGRITTPKLAVLEAIARALSIDPVVLTGKKATVTANAMPANPERKKIAVPILGSVSAGDDRNVVGYIMEDRNNLSSAEGYVYLVVKGDSMYPEFKDEDKVLVKCCSEAETGEYAVVAVDGDDGVVKRIELGNGFITLHSVNPMYPPRKFEGDEMSRIRIFGVVRGLRRNY